MSETTGHRRQKVAIIGSGIAGLTAAYLLNREHEITLYEANDYLGGHTHTKDVVRNGVTYPINTGFIVFNDWTYPNFIKLMDQIGVQSENFEMSFSVRCENTDLEYNGTTINTLFAQRTNILRPRFLFMIKDILRFNKETVKALDEDTIKDSETLGEYLTINNYGEGFIRHYIVPMGAAIWSASVDMMMDFPLKFFLRFFNNHGMLSVDDRPQWRVISGGSRTYIEPLISSFKEKIRYDSKVLRVSREQSHVTVQTVHGDRDVYDQVIFACHSDQALTMLAEPSKEESQILGSLPYQDNSVVLHTDTRLMPKKKLAWASWNYHLPQRNSDRATLTYNMNILQNFHDAPETFLVTLNRTHEIDPDKVIAQYNYSHPVFTLDGIEAQNQHHKISGFNNTHYCGAYWFNGFHEDGVKSALRVASAFGIQL